MSEWHTPVGQFGRYVDLRGKSLLDMLVAASDVATLPNPFDRLDHAIPAHLLAKKEANYPIAILAGRLAAELFVVCDLQNPNDPVNPWQQMTAECETAWAAQHPDVSNRPAADAPAAMALH